VSWKLKIVRSNSQSIECHTPEEEEQTKYTGFLCKIQLNILSFVEAHIELNDGAENVQ